jgi:hypothetical protein
MEFLDLLYLAMEAILAIFVALSSIVFVFLQQIWSLVGHIDAQQQGKDSHLAAFLGGQAGGLVCFCGEQVPKEGHHLSTVAV